MMKIVMIFAMSMFVSATSVALSQEAGNNPNFDFAKAEKMFAGAHVPKTQELVGAWMMIGGATNSQTPSWEVGYFPDGIITSNIGNKGYIWNFFMFAKDIFGTNTLLFERVRTSEGKYNNIWDSKRLVMYKSEVTRLTPETDTLCEQTLVFRITKDNMLITKTQATQSSVCQGSDKNYRIYKTAAAAQKNPPLNGNSAYFSFEAAEEAFAKARIPQLNELLGNWMRFGGAMSGGSLFSGFGYFPDGITDNGGEKGSFLYSFTSTEDVFGDKINLAEEAWATDGKNEVLSTDQIVVNQNGIHVVNQGSDKTCSFVLSFRLTEKNYLITKRTITDQSEGCKSLAGHYKIYMQNTAN